MPQIGVMLPAAPGSNPRSTHSVKACAKLGYVEGRDIALEARFTNQMARLPDLAADLVGLGVDVIAVVGAVTARAAMRATADIPIVFTVVVDAVEDELVRVMERPGGNVTGVTSFDPEQPRSQMRLLKETIPGLQRVAILGDAAIRGALMAANEAAAKAEGLHPQALLLQGPAPDLDGAFAAIRQAGAGALLVLEVPVTNAHAGRIAELARAMRLPSMFAADRAAYAPMIAYGTSILEAAGRMAGMVDRILRGARPGDLPVEAVTRHGLVVNLKVAQEIGVTIPPEILGRADRVIK
ncbi:ABC transporter substrate-binding protein [Dankookia sp. P2]|uniref:ABC transporter substrate-binding protein n=1 Tax=Dankookia sp. P2 TaxID=3423955 RepID=UPI003D66E797